MKSLVVFYSRSGHTKKVAESISAGLGAEIEEIIDTKKRSGPIGFMVSGKDAVQKKLTKLRESSKDPGDYDIVIIGTPIWVGAMSAPIRTYLTEKKEKLGKVAFFCTAGSDDGKRTFSAMEELCGKEPASVLTVHTKVVKAGNFEKDVERFAGEIGQED